MEAASIAHAEHHGPPLANRSSRVDAQLLGMLLFIISEIMLFGAFFTAYFFMRVVKGDPWPAPGTEIPVAVAAVYLSRNSLRHLQWSLLFTPGGNSFSSIGLN